MEMMSWSTRHLRACFVGLILSALVLAAASSSARPEVLLKGYEHVRAEEWFKFYIYGVGMGYSWANAALESRKAKPLYCVPPKLVLEAENYLRTLDREIKESQSKTDLTLDTPVEAVLLRALIKTFPCTDR